MSKLFFFFFLCVLTLFLFLMGMMASVKFFVSGRSIRASVSKKELTLNDSLFYRDSTLGAVKVCWEFGDGAESHTKSGYYHFREVGKYLIRLTVDDVMQTFFQVDVTKEKREKNYSPIRIVAPVRVMQNECVVFMADGVASDWRWEFGLSGVVDSQDRNPIYSYSLPGIYEVRLITENMQYPITHAIEVLPEFVDADSSDVFSLIATDIQEHLQRIVDERTFNEDYNYVLKRYLGGNSEVRVLVNNKKENDFYSYCYGLNILGKQHSTVIEEVVIEADSDVRAVKKLLISQSSSKD